MVSNPALTHEASRGRDDAVVTGLVTRARNGERQAWDALVDRYAPLIWSICRRHRLEAADAEDAQNVWLKLVDQLDNIHDPAAALPGWLAAGTLPDNHAPAAEQDLLAAEHHAALREAFGQLPRAASSCSPCSSKILRCRMRKSAPGWASRSAASGRAAAAAWTSCAATRPSPR